jgi:transposase
MQDANITPENLPSDLPAAHTLINDLLGKLSRQQNQINHIMSYLDRLKRRAVDHSNPQQQSLFGDPPVEQQPEPTPIEIPLISNNDTSTKPKKKGHGRRKLPENLERKRVVHDLSEAEKSCPCCGGHRIKIGEESSEKLDIIPTQLFIIEHVRIKYGCQKCLKMKAENVNQIDETPSVITIAPLPPSIVEKGLAEPGLLAHVIVNKYTDHLPLARQETIFKRQRIDLSRKTMCDWMAQCAEALRPIYKLMLNHVLKSKVIQCDETRVPVQDKGQTRSGRLWVYLGDRNFPYTVYDYRPDKSRAGPEEILKTYQGYLQADAANVFDQMYVPGDIIEVGCWAHAIRHVREAESNDIVLSLQAQSKIRNLYRVEDEIKADLATSPSLTGDQIIALTKKQRQLKSVPLLSDLKMWIEKVLPSTLPKSPIHQGLNYILRHWQALNRFIEQGYLNLDNNAAERGFRPIGIGRRNWLFAGSDNGGKTAAILFTITQTCRTFGINPWDYLKTTFEKLPINPNDQIHNLLPKI